MLVLFALRLLSRFSAPVGVRNTKGTELCMYRGKCSRCKEFVPCKSEAGPVALLAERGQVALSFLLCRPCLNWLIGR